MTMNTVSTKDIMGTCEETNRMTKRFWLTRLAKRSNSIVQKNLRKAEFYKWLGEITINWKSDWIWRYACCMAIAYSSSCDPWLENSQVAIDKLEEMNRN